MKKLENTHKKLVVAKLTKPKNLNQEILLWCATFWYKTLNANRMKDNNANPSEESEIYKLALVRLRTYAAN